MQVEVTELDADPVEIDRPAADRFVRRVLRVQDAPPATAGAARAALRTSVLVAAVRCTLVYIVLPFVLPVVGIVTQVGAGVAAAIGVVAVVCIVSSMRRFWRAEHPARWAYTAIGSIVMVSLSVLVVIDMVRAVRGD